MAEELHDLTIETINMHFQVQKDLGGEIEPFHKQSMAFLHIGYTVGIRRGGFSEAEGMQVIEKTQQLLKETNPEAFDF